MNRSVDLSALADRTLWTYQIVGAVNLAVSCVYLTWVCVTALQIDAPLWGWRGWIVNGSVVAVLFLLGRIESSRFDSLESKSECTFTARPTGSGGWLLLLLYLGFTAGMAVRDLALRREPGRNVIGVVTETTGGRNPGTFGWWEVGGRRYSGDLPYTTYQAQPLGWRVPFQVSVRNPAVVVTTHDFWLHIGFLCFAALVMSFIAWATFTNYKELTGQLRAFAAIPGRRSPPEDT